MRIGFDAKRFFNNFTGLGNYSRFVVSALSEYYPEHEFTLYSPRVRNHQEVDSILQHPSIKVKQPSSLTSPFKLGSFWRSYHLGNVAGQEGMQVFHGLSNELPLTKPKQLRTVLTVHDLIFKRFPSFYKSIDSKIYNWKMIKACQSADRIIAVSQQTASDLMEFLHVDSARIEVVYQGCHPNFKKTITQQQLEEVRLRYKLPAEFILNVGTIESRKNVMLLLQALKSLKHDLPVVVVGKVTPYLIALTDYIMANGLEKRVIFIHQAAFTDLPAIYRLSKVFVYPSLFEGFGIPIVEAISCGVPVITSQGSCFSEAGGPDCLYVDPKDPVQLSDALESLLSDEGRVNQMTQKSKAYIEQFEPNVIASQLMNIYQGLI